MNRESNKWVIIFVIMLSVILTTALMNKDHTDNSISGATSGINTDNGDTDINWERYPTANINLSDSLQITKSGTYHLTGSLNNGGITIKAGAEGVVRLILDHVFIHNPNGPAIACLSGDDLVIELIGKNELSDGEEYSTDYDEDVTGTIYSKADLTFQGDGMISLTANHEDGIVSKDDLKFSSGTYQITSPDDGIRGKDSVYILGGNFTIDSIADAIKSTNESDPTKGFVMIQGGDFSLTTGAKGVKAVNNIVIEGGNFALSTTDDAIHSDSFIGIKGGKFNINSGDDGIHANRELLIEGGDLTIAKSYEGLEAQVVTISGGNLSLTSIDDGINAGGGADSSANNRPGANPFAGDENCVLTINGGDIYINASGDGIDSNGWLYINGGRTIVDGPTNNGNGALDAGMGIIMTDGEALAIGASGMAESLGDTSSVNNISIYLSETAPAKTEIRLVDSNGDTVIEHASTKSFNHIAFGSKSLEFGKTYTLYLDNEPTEKFTISSIVTTVGRNTNMSPNSNQAPASRPNAN